MDIDTGIGFTGLLLCMVMVLVFFFGYAVGNVAGKEKAYNEVISIYEETDKESFINIINKMREE